MCTLNTPGRSITYTYCTEIHNLEYLLNIVFIKERREKDFFKFDIRKEIRNTYGQTCILNN